MNPEEAAKARAAAIQSLAGGVVASVQAQAHEPFYEDAPFCAMAQSAMQGGVVGLRLAGARHIGLMRASHPDLPIIGLTKPEPLPANARDAVYITPTFADVSTLADAGATLIALDATDRPRPGGETLPEIVARARERYPAIALMADVSSAQDAVRAEAIGFDVISTTLSGYTAETAARDDGLPDFDLLSALIETRKLPVACEGRIWTPEQAVEAFARGAHCVVIGSAITRPHLIARRFVQASPGSGGPWP